MGALRCSQPIERHALYFPKRASSASMAATKGTHLLVEATMKTPKKKKDEGGETFPLAKSIADELGDGPAGTPVTLAMFQRCLYRLADIRSGRVKKPEKHLPG